MSQEEAFFFFTPQRERCSERHYMRKTEMEGREREREREGKKEREKERDVETKRDV